MATEDILINDGDGFVSLSELAAEQVDVALPISSEDGTVTLDSPSANTFTISTGGSERIRVNSSALDVISSNGNNLTSLTSGNSVAVFDVDLAKKVSNSAFGIRIDGTYRFYMVENGNVGIGDTVTNVPQLLTVKGDVSGSSFVQNESSTCGVFFPSTTSLEIHPASNQVSFYADPATTRVSGPNANDARVDLDSWIIFSTNDEDRLSITLQGDIVAADDYVPQQPQSLATKQIVEDKIWVGTTVQYNALVTKNPTTLYCLTD